MSVFAHVNMWICCTYLSSNVVCSAFITNWMHLYIVRRDGDGWGIYCSGNSARHSAMKSPGLCLSGLSWVLVTGFSNIQHRLTSHASLSFLVTLICGLMVINIWGPLSLAVPGINWMHLDMVRCDGDVWRIYWSGNSARHSPMKGPRPDFSGLSAGSWFFRSLACPLISLLLSLPLSNAWCSAVCSTQTHLHFMLPIAN